MSEYKESSLDFSVQSEITLNNAVIDISSSDLRSNYSIDSVVAQQGSMTPDILLRTKNILKAYGNEKEYRFIDSPNYDTAIESMNSDSSDESITSMKLCQSPIVAASHDDLIHKVSNSKPVFEDSSGYEGNVINNITNYNNGPYKILEKSSTFYNELPSHINIKTNLYKYLINRSTSLSKQSDSMSLSSSVQSTRYTGHEFEQLQDILFSEHWQNKIQKFPRTDEPESDYSCKEHTKSTPVSNSSSSLKNVIRKTTDPNEEKENSQLKLIEVDANKLTTHKNTTISTTPIKSVACLRQLFSPHQPINIGTGKERLNPPRIIVTKSTPSPKNAKFPQVENKKGYNLSKIIPGKGREIISPVGEYIRGNGTVMNARKIVFNI